MSVDVSRVPAYPVVRLELRSADDAVEGWVDGVKVADGPNEESVRDELVARASEVAAARPGVRAVRALGMWSGREFELVVTGDGEVLSRDAGAPSGEPGSRRKKWVPLALVAAVAVPGLVAGIVSVSSPSSTPAVSAPQTAKPSVARPTATELPVQPPAGRSRVAKWSVASADLSSGLSLASVGSVVVIPSGDGSRVAGVDARTGAQRWSSATGEPVTTGVVTSRVDGRLVVVAATSATVFAWDPSTGAQRGKWAIPEGSSGVLATASGLVVLGPGSRGHVATSKGLVARVVPAGAVVVGTTGSSLRAAGANQLWTVTSDRVAGKPIKLPDVPKGLSWRGVAGQTEHGFFAVYGAAESSTVVLRLIDFSGRVSWSSGPVPAVAAAGSAGARALRVSPSGAYGVYGSTLVDLKSGGVKRLPSDWTTSSLESVLYGSTGATAAWVDPKTAKVHATDVAGADQTSQPGQVTGEVDGLALVAARDGDQPRLYAVPQEAGVGRG